MAQDILDQQPVKRFPILTSLTSKSPMHGGIDYHLKSFLADQNLDTNFEAFQKLMYRGKLVFLLDGFDEMGFIGSHDQRFDQLNAIWQLATKGNKVVISGRPSYFPDEFEERQYLNIIADADKKMPQERPYCHRVQLDFFDDAKIKASIKAYYPEAQQLNTFFNFVKGNDSVYELCRRPSMLHIVREMLPDLLVEYKDKKLKAGDLMKRYINHWVQRQFDKSIVSAVKSDTIKTAFIFDFFRDLVGKHYDDTNGSIALSAEDIRAFLKDKIKAFKLTSDEDFQGFESEIQTAYFVERQNNTYKFVHKSFLEYFVAQRIIYLMKQKDFKDRLIETANWSDEIQTFVYESVPVQDIQNSEDKGIPLLVYLARPKTARILTWSYRVESWLRYNLNVFCNNFLLFFFPTIHKHLYILLLTMIIVCAQSLGSQKIFYITLTVLGTINAFLFLISFYDFAINSATNQMFNFKKIKSHFLTSLLALIYLGAIQKFFLGDYETRVVFKALIRKLFDSNLISLFVAYSIVLILSKLYKLIRKNLYSKLTAKGFSILFNRGILKISQHFSAFFSLSPYSNNINSISDDIVLEPYSSIYFKNTMLKKCSINGFMTKLVNCKCQEVQFKGKHLGLQFISCTFENVHFDEIVPRIKKHFLLNFKDCTLEQFDAPTLASLHRLIARQGLIIGQHITGDEGLLAALKQLPEAAETVENG